MREVKGTDFGVMSIEEIVKMMDKIKNNFKKGEVIKYLIFCNIIDMLTEKRKCNLFMSMFKSLKDIELRL